MRILINLKDIYEKKMEIILREIKKENVDINFLYLFESKIKYKLIECEIIKKQYKMSDDVENIIKIFNEKGMKFYVIKTLLLISNFFWEKSKEGKNVKESKFEFLLYLNLMKFFFPLVIYSNLLI